MGRGVKLIYYMQKFVIGRDIRHRFAVMRKADITFCIHDTAQRHPTQLEQVHFLAVCACHGMIRVRQADKGDALIFPIFQKDRFRIWPYGENFRAAAPKLVISIPQARQLRAAVGSHEAAQQGKHNRFAAEIG